MCILPVQIICLWFCRLLDFTIYFPNKCLYNIRRSNTIIKEAVIMSYTSSYSTFNPACMSLVPVIASYNTAGEIRPLYVRIEDISYKIVSCKFISSVALLRFKCQIIDNNILRPLELTYHPKEFIWTIPLV